MTDFWSKRRAGVQAETEADEAAQIVFEVEAEAAEKSDEDLLEELGLPDPDALSDGDDFSVFMAEAVPARLKTRALRKLWRLNPVLANVDGLVDYGEDFTDAATVVENLQTTYQVGKGMLEHVKELARKAAEEAERDEGEEFDDAPVETIEEEEKVMMAEVEAADLPKPAPITFVPEEEEAHIPAPTRHRMRFEFEDRNTG